MTRQSRSVPSLPRGLVVRETGCNERTLGLAKTALLELFMSRGKHEIRFAAARYVFHVTGHLYEYGYNQNIGMEVEPLGGRPALGGFFNDKKIKVYRTPSPEYILNRIEPNSGLAYRGMSWEEWASILRRGRIQSRGWYNLGQDNYTMFGREPDTALSYANGFAPWLYKPGEAVPSVIIAVPKALMLTYLDDEAQIPRDELALVGSAPMSVIAEKYLVIPTEIEWGGGQLVLNRRLDNPRFTAFQNGRLPSVSHVISQFD